mgnify:CR=1 FL=1
MEIVCHGAYLLSLDGLSQQHDQADAIAHLVNLPIKYVRRVLAAVMLLATKDLSGNRSKEKVLKFFRNENADLSSYMCTFQAGVKLIHSIAQLRAG